MCEPEGGYSVLSSLTRSSSYSFHSRLGREPGWGRGEGGGGASERMDFLLFCMFNIEVPVPWEIMAFEYAHNLELCLLNYSRGTLAPMNLTFWDYSSNSQPYLDFILLTIIEQL